jgi:SAM-dependent methyltransferase
MGTTDGANDRWAGMVADWAIPDALVAAAPEPPYFFDPAVFVAAADEALARTEDSPSDAAARAALPAGGTVLDVGAGAGAASLRLPARTLVGVDPSRVLLDAFATRAARRGSEATTVEGMWPEVAPRTPTADVVVCHHVVYNVADLARFAAALSDHAQRRVVVELTAVHPMAWMTPYWEALQDVPQPARPTVDDALAVLAGLGYAVQREQWTRAVQMIGENGPEGAARIARRLCLPAERRPELERMLRAIPPPVLREVETLWWDTGPA